MADKMMVTEALAEIKTIGKRIEKKQEFVMAYLLRQEKLKDPLLRSGGSVKALAEEQQAIGDLQERIINIRRAIQRANTDNSIVIGTTGRSIGDWLTWRREVAPVEQNRLKQLRQALDQARRQAQQKGVAVVGIGAVATTPDDLVVNIDEQKLAQDIEALENALGILDGQLSLKNATIMVEI